MAREVIISDDVFAPLRGVAQRALALWNDGYAEIERLGDKVQQHVAPLGRSLADSDEIIRGRLSYVSSLELPGKTSQALVLQPSMDAAIQAATALEVQVRQVQSYVQGARDAGGLSNFEPSNGQIYTLNGNAFPIAGNISNAISYSDQILTALSTVQALVRVKGTSDLSQSFQTVRARITELDESVKAVTVSRNQATKKLEETTSAGVKTHALAEQVQELSARVQALATQIQDDASKGSAGIAQIERTVAASDALDPKVREATIILATFSSDLETKRQELYLLTKAAAETKQEQSDLVENIHRIAEEADAMLKGASVAGLASSFHETYQKYRIDSQWAMLFTYASLIILFLSVGLLATYVYPSTLPFGLSFLRGKPVDLAGVIARTVVILPALALVAFSAQRYNSLFAMQREYAHRATISRAIEGFRRLAPRHEETIAAAVFLTLQENPSAAHQRAANRDTAMQAKILESLIKEVKTLAPGFTLGGGR